MIETREKTPLLKENYEHEHDTISNSFITFSTYCCCSFIMTIGNKILVSNFRIPLILSFIQVTISFIFSFCTIFGEINFESWHDVWRWVRSMSTSFLLILVSNMFVTDHVSLGTQILVRNLNPILTVFFEKIIYKYEINIYSFISLMSIIPGTLIYMKEDIGLSHIGIFWMTLNTLATSFQRILQKELLSKKNGVKMSKMAMILFNNLFSLLFIIPFIYFYEYNGIFKLKIYYNSIWDYFLLVLIFLTSVVGFFIGYLGIKAQEILSPSSMLVLVNSNKFAAILFSIMFMNEPRSAKSILGCTLSLFSTCWYGYLQTVDINNKTDTQKKTILIFVLMFLCLFVCLILKIK